MLPLVEIPPTVKKYAGGYQDLFSPGQNERWTSGYIRVNVRPFPSCRKAG